MNLEIQRTILNVTVTGGRIIDNRYATFEFEGETYSLAKGLEKVNEVLREHPCVSPRNPAKVRFSYGMKTNRGEVIRTAEADCKVRQL